MSSYSKIIGICAAAFLAAMWAVPASAQATRTWVSGVGDDANPCSRTAPCKTFAGTISKTAPGGEIDVLDPGSFGTVTITKSITIDGSGGSIAGTLASGTNGMVVNDSGAGTVNVTIRNVAFEGVGFTASSSGVRGIWFISGAVLNVQHCVIRNFRDATNGMGIGFLPSTAAKLYVDDTILTGNGNGSVGGGIVIQPTITGATAVLHNVRAEGNANVGLLVNSSSIGAGGTLNVTATNSVFAGSTFGVDAISGAATGTANVTLTGDTISGNSVAGVLANGATARIVLGLSTLGNNGTGMGAINSGFMGSFGDNYFNGTMGTASLPAPTKG